MLDARREEGSRVAAMFPPCAVDGPTLTVRKFTHRFTLEDLISVGTLTAPLANVLRAAVEARHNILISGGTGTGKTTLLNAVVQRRRDDSFEFPVRWPAKYSASVSRSRG